MNTILGTTCPQCKKWLSLDEIVTGGALEPIGMQVDIKNPSTNYFYFNHIVPGCHGMLAIDVKKFDRYINEKIPHVNNAGQEGCEENCLRLESLRTCQNNCHWAPYRRFLVNLYHDFTACNIFTR